MNTATSTYPTKGMSLTSQTSNALSLSIRGIIEIIKMLLGKGIIKYVLTQTSTYQTFFHDHETTHTQKMNVGSNDQELEELDNCFEGHRISVKSRGHHFTIYLVMSIPKMT